MASVAALAEESSEAVLRRTEIVSASYDYLQWIKTDLLVFVACMVGLEKLAKVSVLAQRLSELAEDAVAGEAGRGSLGSRSFPPLAMSPPHTKRK